MHHIPYVQIENPIVLLLHSQDSLNIVSKGCKVIRLSVLPSCIIVR